MEISRPPTSRQREASIKAANRYFEVREDRASVAKHELETSRAADAAKTARLRALRLEKEQAERDAEARKPSQIPEQG